MPKRCSRRTWILVTGLLLLGSACAGHRTARNAETWHDPRAVHLSVNNQFGFPITVFAVGSGISVRIGKVLPEMVGHFTLPKSVVGNGTVEIVAVADGDAPARSGPLLLAPGHVVEFVISRPTYRSTATIRR